MAPVLQLRLLAAARERDQVPQQGPCRPVRGLQHPPRGPSQSSDGGCAANLQACECRTPRDAVSSRSGSRDCIATPRRVS